MVNNVKSSRKIQRKKNKNVIVQSGENIVYNITKLQNGLCTVSCSIGIAEVVFLERSLWRTTFLRILDRNGRFGNGTVVFQKIFVE